MAESAVRSQAAMDLAPTPPSLGPTAHPNRCVLCGGTGDEVVWRESGYDGRRCACGVVYVDPMPGDGGIDFTRDLHDGPFYARPARERLAWFVERHEARGRLLEVGCGEGWFLEAAREKGFEVEGLEPEPARAARVRARLGVPVTCGYIEGAALPAGSFDVVYHTDLVSHFPDPVGALRAMARLLKPGGVLFFEAGLHTGFSPLWYRVVGSMGYPMHLWFYDEPAFARLMDAADLRVDDRKTFHLGPYVLGSRVAHGVAKAARLGLGAYEKARGARPAWAPADRAIDAVRDRATNALRYEVAARSPAWGPKTLWVIASPRTAP